MLTGFQQYLVDRGFIRSCIKFKYEEEENYTSDFLSSYGPTHYNFKSGNHCCYWGLCEKNKPPVMYLGTNKIFIYQNKENKENFRYPEDGYRILFSKWKEDKYDEIYNAFITPGKYFKIDCRNEKNITIEIATNEYLINLKGSYFHTDYSFPE